MIITSAKYQSDGNVTATANGITVSGIHPASRYWKHIEEWVAEGNTIEAADPAPPPPTNDEIYDQMMLNNRLLKALAMSINDGTFVTGANNTGAQMKAIIKENM